MACLFKRGKTYYLSYFEGVKRKKISLKTDVYNLAIEKKRQLESAMANGNDSPLPTKTPLADILSRYIQNMRAKKTAKSAQTDTYYLKVIFGDICPEIINNRRRATHDKKKKPSKKKTSDNIISARYIEDVSTVQIANFISDKVRSKGLAPKTANRYREIICRLFNWAMTEGGVRMPNDKNPASKVEKYRERASEISFLTMNQIEEQLAALQDAPQLQIMVAVLIYAGLRREELLWLTREDIDLRKGMISVRAKTINGEYWELVISIENGARFASKSEPLRLVK